MLIKKHSSKIYLLTDTESTPLSSKDTGGRSAAEWVNWSKSWAIKEPEAPYRETFLEVSEWRWALKQSQ